MYQSSPTFANLPVEFIEDAITICLGQQIKMGTMPSRVINEVSMGHAAHSLPTAVELGDQLPIIRDGAGNLADLQFVLHQLGQYTNSQANLIKHNVSCRKDLYQITDAVRLLRAIELELDAVSACNKTLEQWKEQYTVVTKMGLSTFLLTRLGIEELTNLTVMSGSTTLHDTRVREFLSIQHSLMTSGRYEAVRFSSELMSMLPRVDFTSKETYMNMLFTLYGKVQYSHIKAGAEQMSIRQQAFGAGQYSRNQPTRRNRFSDALSPESSREFR